VKKKEAHYLSNFSFSLANQNNNAELMTQNKYTNWNVVAVVVHVYKENKKICEN